MFIEVNGDEARVVKSVEKKKPEIICTIDRVKDELEGFLKYKEMSKDGHVRYDLPSMQEFQHMLLATDDFFTQLKPQLTPDEHQELVKFCKSLNQSIL